MKIQSILPMSLLLLTVSACSETPDIEQEAPGIPQTLVAEIAEDFTRTAFLSDADGNENSRFTWLAGDRIKMLLTDNTFATYEATADGRSAQFDLVDTDVNVQPAANMGRFSIYPATSALISNGKPAVSLNGYAPDFSKPNLLSTVPMIANNYIRGYSIFEPYLWFHVATAVLKVDIENIPVAGLSAYVSHPTYPLCGDFSIADDAHIYASDMIDGPVPASLSFWCLPAGNFSMFIPVPLGEMSAGLEVGVFQSADGKILATATTNKAIKLEAGKGYDLGTLHCHDIDTQTTVEWDGAKNVTIKMAEGTTAVEVAWLQYMYYSNCSLYEEATYNRFWVPNRTRFEASGTYPFNLPPAEEALNGKSQSREFALVYRTIGKDGFDYYAVAWRGWIPDELYDDVDLSWSKIDVGFGS